MQSKFMLLALVFLMIGCGNSDSEIPLIAPPGEFRYSSDQLPPATKHPAFDSPVRILGEVTIDGAVKMLVTTSKLAPESPWGEVLGHLIRDGKVLETILLSYEFSDGQSYSVLDEQLELETVEISMDEETGDEQEQRTRIRLLDKVGS